MQNILLITSDQQHWNTLGCVNASISTPNLDRLAAQGCLFDRAYCPNPTCTPTRASIITGSYPSQHGAYSLGTKLSEDQPTLGQILGSRGYRSSLIGKAHFQPLLGNDEHSSLEAYPLLWDLDYWRSFHGPFYGFDHVELARNHADEPHVGQHYALWMEERGFKDWRRHFQNQWGDFKDNTFATKPQRLTWSIPEEHHYNNWIAERSIAQLEASKTEGQPFFLWSSFFDPHPPYLVPEPWDKLYNPKAVQVPHLRKGEHSRNPEHFAKTQEPNPDFSMWEEPEGNAMHGCESHLHDDEELAKEVAVYYGMISCMDKYIGRILDRLDELGLAEETLVVFTSDHGHLFGQHGLIAKGPFHYEDLVKVPFIARWPNRIAAGSRSGAMQSLVDLAPSFLDAAGVEVPRRMSGVSQVPAWTGEKTSVRDHVLVENRHQPTTVNLLTYVNERYKITAYYNREYGELFDLVEDPDEYRNLWNSPDHQALKADLLLKLVHAEQGKSPLLMPRISVA